MINDRLKDTFDKAFNIHSDNSNLLVQLIIEDRRYKIPDWFFRYINEDILVSIIYSKDRLDACESIYDKDFVKFLSDCEKHKVIKNYKAFCIYLLENKLLRYGFFINPKYLFKYTANLLDESDRHSTIDLIIFVILYRSSLDPIYLSYYWHTYPNYELYKNGLSAFDELFETVKFNKELSDIIFCTIYNKYGKSYDIYHDGSACNWYWRKIGGDAIPDNISLSEVDKYVEYKVKSASPQSSVYLNPKIRDIVKAHKTDTTRSDILYRSTISDNIMYTIHNNINNISCIFWKPSVIELNKILNSYNHNPGKLQDYGVFYKLTKKRFNYYELVTYLINGGNYTSLSKLFNKLSGIDIHDFIDVLFTSYPDKDVLTDILLSDDNTPFIISQIPFFEFIMREYVDNERNMQTRGKLAEIILPNKNLIDKLYKSPNGYTRLNTLIDWSHVSNADIIAKYPNLLEDLDTVALSSTVKQALKINYDIIYSIPWVNLLKHDIIKEIRLNGYFPFISTNPKDFISNHISPVELFNMITNGVGFGYIIDFEFTEIVNMLLTGAIQYIENKK